MLALREHWFVAARLRACRGKRLPRHHIEPDLGPLPPLQILVLIRKQQYNLKKRQHNNLFEQVYDYGHIKNDLDLPLNLRKSYLYFVAQTIQMCILATVIFRKGSANNV